MNDNPYAAPATSPEELTADSSQEQIRKEHIATESSIKTIGFLYYLACFGGIVGLLGLGLDSESDLSEKGVALLAIAGFTLLTGLLAFYIRRFSPPARIGATFFSVIGLAGFPLGTIINIYFLYLLLGKKGKVVFSPEYREVIANTPHIKYRTSKVTWVILALLITIIIAMIVVASQ